MKHINILQNVSLQYNYRKDTMNKSYNMKIFHLITSIIEVRPFPFVSSNITILLLVGFYKMLLK